MDPYNGLLDVAVEMDILQKKGGWYVYNGENIRAADFAKIAPEVLIKCETQRDKFLEAALDEEEEVVEKQDTSKAKREKKAKGE